MTSYPLHNLLLLFYFCVHLKACVDTAEWNRGIFQHQCLAHTAMLARDKEIHRHRNRGGSEALVGIQPREMRAMGESGRVKCITTNEYTDPSRADRGRLLLGILFHQYIHVNSSTDDETAAKRGIRER